MFAHYLKIAFRNLTKYKMQTIISIIGLAVGFVCFALSALWIRYEMTFDTFHRDANRMYVVYTPDEFQTRDSRFRRGTPLPLAVYLTESFPEVADAISLSSRREDITVDGVISSVLIIRADTSLFRMFDVRIIEGSPHFLMHESGEAAITQRKARRLFGNENPIGRNVYLWGQDYTIGAIVADMPKRSNYPFDLIMPFRRPDPEREWNNRIANTIIKLHRGINMEAFQKRLYEHDFTRDDWSRSRLNGMTIKPLTRMRYLDPDIARDVRFQHIFIFALSGLLVVLCSLFNYLTLFVSRFRMRQKEMALRKVCGASGRSLLAMLSVEFILTLLFAVLLGGLLTRLMHSGFLELSDIQMSLAEIYRDLFIYVGGIFVLSLLVFWLIVFILQRQSLNLSIRQNNQKISRKVSVIAQLIISIGFAFCSIVLLKQMHFLQHTDELGFSFQNRGAVRVANVSEGSVLVNRLEQIPELTRVVNATGMSNLVPLFATGWTLITSWDNQPVENTEEKRIHNMFVTPEYIDFWNFQLIAGEMLTDGSPEGAVLLNESAVRAFGWYDAVGKNLGRFSTNFTVKGVIRNIYNAAPTVQASPILYQMLSESSFHSPDPLVLFQYHENSWEIARERIEQVIDDLFGDLVFYSIYNSTEEYAKFLQSENALMRLLFFVSLICILICIFGFVSLVSLTCEERRKQIAIRKISGATVGDILAIFAKEYFLLLIIGAVIAFSGGYIIMQRWLEQYVKQTAIEVWVYLSIIFVMVLVIVLCVGWRVWKTSRENPADVLKSE